MMIDLETIKAALAAATIGSKPFVDKDEPDAIQVMGGDAYCYGHNRENNAALIAAAPAWLAELVERVERAEADGRRQGRADVAKYSNAIGRIEAALGYAGARPMRETVVAVEALVARAESAEAEVARLREALKRYGRHDGECNTNYRYFTATPTSTNQILDSRPCDCGYDAAQSGDG